MSTLILARLTPHRMDAGKVHYCDVVKTSLTPLTRAVTGAEVR